MKLANINKGKKSINIGFDYSDGKSIDQKDMNHKTPLTPTPSSSSSSKQLSSTSSSSVVTSTEISSSSPASSTVTQESLSSSHRSFQDFKGEEDSQIEILMKQQFASSVADQIVNSHQAARKVAKELVIEVLQSEGTVNELGSLLGMCFAYPTVQAPIRSLAYFYLHTDNTMDNILWQLEWQRHYFFGGDGKEWTETKIKDLFVWWLGTDDFKAVLYPLVFWVLRDRDIAVVPLSQMNAEYYDFYREWFAQNFETVVIDHLKSEREQLKAAASEVIKEMLISNFKSKAGSDDKKPSGTETSDTN